MAKSGSHFRDVKHPEVWSFHGGSGLITVDSVKVQGTICFLCVHV